VPTLALALILGAAPAAAQDVEVTPRTSSGPVLISAGDDDTIYYALDANGSLDYPAAGPVELVLKTRLRVPAGRRSSSGVVEAYGDGEFRIPDIVVQGRGVVDGQVFDARGGVPSAAVVTTVAIPPGAASLTLKAPAGGPDFLVRITRRAAPEPVTVPVPPVALATIEEPPPEPVAPAEPTGDLALATKGACPDPALAVSVVEAEVASEPSSFWEDHPPKAGVELGLGVPARGTAAVVYYGLQGRLGIVENVVDGALSVGAYRVGVEESYQLTDPYAGPISVAADYHTTVVPVELAGLYRVPMILLGIVHPFAGAGVSVDFTRRADGDEHVGGVGLGSTLFAGADVDAGPGQLSASLGWNGFRHDYGNVNAAGEPVRETLATVRLDVAWLYAF
jgi:hypothetical protein